MIRFNFDEEKATQVAARLLSKTGNRMPHLALMKLLYIVERQALEQWGEPIIGGRYFSMPHGPVVSEVLDRMKLLEGVEESGYWTQHLTKMGHEMQLKKVPGESRLSAAELGLIDEVFAKNKHLNKWELRDLTHLFPEWEDPKGSSKPIEIELLLKVLGKSPDEIRALAAEAEHEAKIDALIRPAE